MAKSSYAAAVAMTLACVLFATAGFAANGKPRSAYEDMQPEKLAKRLAEMGMTELHEAFMKELGAEGDGSVRDFVLAATGRIALAKRTGDLEARGRLMEGAIAALRKIVELSKKDFAAKDAVAREAAAKAGDSGVMADKAAAAKVNAAEALIRHYRFQLQLAEAMGVIYTEPYVTRLLYLQGGALDRQAILAKTPEAVRILAVLDERARGKLMDWRGDENLELLVTVVPELEDLHKKVGYKLGWIRCYQAMATPIDEAHRGRRITLLDAGMTNLRPFAHGKNEDGVKYPALGGYGRMCLERALSAKDAKEKDSGHKKAADSFQAIISAGVKATGPGLRILTMFEIARNLIEKGDFEQAGKAVDNFSNECKKLVRGKSGQLQADVKSAMLQNYRYERWAASVRKTNPTKADEYDLEAQKALVGFVQKYKDVEIRRAFYRMIATKYRDRTDYEKLNAMILLAVAGYENSLDTEESLSKAGDLLGRILSRKTQLAQMLRPTVLWELAMALSRQGDLRKAGKTFLTLAKDHPKCPEANQAAIYAVRVFYGIVFDIKAAKGKVISGDLRDEYIDSLKTLVEHPEWGVKADAINWNFDLGQQCRQKAKQMVEPEDVMKWLSEAIRAYEKVPANLPTYMYSQYLALSTRVERLLDETLDAARMDKAASLVKDLKKYARDAEAEAGEKTKDSERNELMAWGARSEFNAAVMYYEKLDQRRLALGMLRSLPKKWPGTPVLSEVTDYQIRKMIESRRTDEAIERIEQFRKDHPRQAEYLIRLVVSQIRERITKLRDRADKSVELRRYQETYLAFAKSLFERANTPHPKPLEQRYAVTQMYADAVLEAGLAGAAAGRAEHAKKLFAEALELFQACRASNDRNRAARAAEYDKKFNAQLRAVAAIAENEAAVRKMAQDHLQQMQQEFGVDISSSSEATALKVALEFLDRAPAEGERLSEAQKKKRLRQVVESLKASVAALRETAKASVPLDLPNILGLARANRRLKNYAEARKFYREMISGINRSEHAELYWRIELEYCWFLREAYGGNKDAMKALEIRIKSLRLEDRDLGGLKYKAKFNAIEAEAGKLSGK